MLLKAQNLKSLLRWHVFLFNTHNIQLLNQQAHHKLLCDPTWTVMNIHSLHRRVVKLTWVCNCWFQKDAKPVGLTTLRNLPPFQNLGSSRVNSGSVNFSFICFPYQLTKRKVIVMLTTHSYILKESTNTSSLTQSTDALSDLNCWTLSQYIKPVPRDLGALFDPGLCFEDKVKRVVQSYFFPAVTIHTFW